MTVNTVQGEGQQKAVTMGRLLTFQLFAASRIQALEFWAFSECPGLALLVSMASPLLPTLPRQTCNSPVMSNPQAWSEYTFSSQFRLLLLAISTTQNLSRPRLHLASSCSEVTGREDSPAQCRHIRLLFRLFCPLSFRFWFQVFVVLVSKSRREKRKI